jgi:cytochrome P450
VRRCLGASFALFEMKTVLEVLVRELDLSAADPGPEPVRRRAITLVPGRGAQAVVRPAPAGAPRETVAA